MWLIALRQWCGNGAPQTHRGVASWAQQNCGTVLLLKEVHTALFCILHSSPMREHCPWLVMGVSLVKCALHKDIGLIHSSDHGSRLFLGTATWVEDESIGKCNGELPTPLVLLGCGI